VRGQDEVANLQADFNAMADELAGTLRDLQQERDRVSRLLRSRREMTAAISHELRTPLATLRGHLETAPARSEGLESAQEEDRTLMLREVLRLQRLIDDLFDLSRLDVEQLSLTPERLDVGEVVVERVRAVAPMAWRSGRVTVVAQPGEESAWAWADRTRLEQILTNLLHNATRHTPPGGIVSVDVSPEKDTVRVDVHDTGSGIPPHELSHVWERFYRGATGRSRQDVGAGLGLALVKELSEAMGGSVGAESEPGQGSCFTVRLPRIRH
jgi:signal transduction histidine kinase